jgi:plastocyanin
MKATLCAAWLAALLGAAVPAAADNARVTVGHNLLQPANLTLSIGQTVEFYNKDEMPGGHTIVADNGTFTSPPLKKGETWSHTFDRAGVYSIHIKQHPDAKATITVR